MAYLRAVLQKDENKKIEELKKLIVLGEKLNKDTTPDKKKLEILEKRLNKKINKIEITPKENSSNLKFPIENVYTKENKIIVDLNVDISKDDIKFFKLKQNDNTKYVFDINGFFKDASPTKLQINGIEKITIGQFKPNVLRIVLSNKSELTTNYELKNRQIIITINNLNENVLQNEELYNPYVDKKNSIRTITSKDDKIFVRFNKNYSNNEIKFTKKRTNSSFEYIFDIKGEFEFTKPTKLILNEVERVVVTQYLNNVRIIIKNKNELNINYSLDKKDFIIKANKKEENNLPYPNFQPKTIVIDPGHGGKDSGAIGPNNELEKVIVLNVSKYLYEMLKKRGHKVFLTRYDDTYLQVKERTILANDKNADIFLSVHVNAIPKDKASEVEGIETFFLSPARSERAKRVAALENKEDIDFMSEASKSVFLESLNRPRITASHKLAIDVQAGLLQSAHLKYKDIKDSGVREGPFWVLVGAQMPSILVELGYISHPTESKKLYNKDYQKTLAAGIANGIDSYFSKNP